MATKHTESQQSLIGVIPDSTTLLQFNTTELRVLIQRVLQLPDGSVRDADSAVETGDDAFISVRVISTQSLGQPRVDYDGMLEKEMVFQTLVSTISINAFGKNANALIFKLQAMLASSVMLSGLNRIKMSVLNCSPVRNLSGSLAGGYEERSQIDLDMMYTHCVSIDQPFISEVDIQFTSSNGLSQTSNVNKDTR